MNGSNPIIYLKFIKHGCKYCHLAMEKSSILHTLVVTISGK